MTQEGASNNPLSGFTTLSPTPNTPEGTFCGLSTKKKPWRSRELTNTKMTWSHTLEPGTNFVTHKRVVMELVDSGRTTTGTLPTLFLLNKVSLWAFERYKQSFGPIGINWIRSWWHVDRTSRGTGHHSTVTLNCCRDQLIVSRDTQSAQS